MMFVRKFLNKILNKNVFIILPDKPFLQLLYYSRTGAFLNFRNTTSFNEKLQWLKVYDRKSIYTLMVDKYEAKKYVSNIIGEKYIIPTIGIYNSFDEIDFDTLPNQFVIKCTHDSGGLAICKDKDKFDYSNAKKNITKSLKNNFFYHAREWPYKNVKPRIIVEKYMEDKKNSTIRDYKFFCFNGEPKIMYISDESHTVNQRIAFFDMNFNKLDIKRKDYKDYETIPSKPTNFKIMQKFAKKLSIGIPHIRVDFYEIDGKLYFGELTFYTGSGFIPFENEKWNKILGDWIKLPKRKENKNEK